MAHKKFTIASVYNTGGTAVAAPLPFRLGDLPSAGAVP